MDDANDPDQASGLAAERRHAPEGRRGAVVALLLILCLAAIGWGVARVLHRTSSLQDCVMSGRSNCAPVGRS